MSSSYGGGSKYRALYGPFIDEALTRNDPNELKGILKQARDQCFYPMYAVAINKAIERGASREELQQLLEQAQATASSDLQGAIQKLQQHLGSAK